MFSATENDFSDILTARLDLIKLDDMNLIEANADAIRVANADADVDASEQTEKT